MPPPNRSGSSRHLGRRPQLSDDVASFVRNRIMAGDVRPGDFVRLDETAAELGVSVTPVREALLTLRGEGLVELVPHRGYVVAPLTRSDIDDVFWLQGCIAEKLAARAAETIGDDTIAELDDINVRFSDAVRTGDGARIETLEFSFHRTLNRAAAARKLAWFLHNATRYTPAHFYSSDQDGASRPSQRTTEFSTRSASTTRTRPEPRPGTISPTEHAASSGIWTTSASGPDLISNRRSRTPGRERPRAVASRRRRRGPPLDGP